MDLSNPGARRSAVLLSAVDAETARLVLKGLPAGERQRVLVEVARLEAHPATPGELREALRAFEDDRRVEARPLLDDLIDPPPAPREPEKAPAPGAPFGALASRDPGQVLAAVQGEHPQTIAVVLAHLPASAGAAVLDRLPLKTQVEVIRRVGSLQAVSPETLAEVERAVEARLAPAAGGDAGGVQTAAALLARVSGDAERGILDGLSAVDGELAGRIRGELFAFDDLRLSDDHGIRALLERVDPSRLAVALKLPAPEVAARLFRNLPDSAAATLEREIESLGPVTLADVTAAREAVAEEARRLEVEGRLRVQGRPPGRVA